MLASKLEKKRIPALTSYPFGMDLNGQRKRTTSPKILVNNLQAPPTWKPPSHLKGRQQMGNKEGNNLWKMVLEGFNACRAALEGGHKLMVDIARSKGV
jgi:hypothetical protein